MDENTIVLTEHEKVILAEKSKEIIKLLFPLGISQQHEAAFTNYITENYKRYHCCVLYLIDEGFKGFLSSLGISHEVVGKKEVILTQNFTIRYSDTYCSVPLEI